MALYGTNWSLCKIMEIIQQIYKISKLMVQKEIIIQYE